MPVSRKGATVTDSAQQPPMPQGYTVELVWENKPEALVEEIIAFWLANKALPSEEAARKRAPQVVGIARDSNSALAGVSTIYQQHHPRFGVTFHFFRCFVG